MSLLTGGRATHRHAADEQADPNRRAGAQGGEDAAFGCCIYFWGAWFASLVGVGFIRVGGF